MRRRSAVIGVTGVVLASLSGGAGAAGGGPSGGYGAYACGLDTMGRDAWHAVPSPGSGTWSTGMVGDDPCTLVAASSGGAVKRSTDGGTSWQTVANNVLGLGTVFTEGLGKTVVIGETTGGGFLLSKDGGRSFTEKTLVSTLPQAVVSKTQVVAVAGDGTHMVLARMLDAVPGTTVHPLGGPTVYTTSDGGSTWLESASSATLAPVAVAYDVDNSVVYLADGSTAAGGVWASSDGQTFTQLLSVSGATDIVANPIEGGGTVVYVAATTGVWDSVDGGSGWGQEGKDAVYALRPEWGRSGMLTGLFASPQVRPGRSPDAGASFYLADKGVPASCAGVSLQRTTDVPSFYLLNCADGRAYRYQSSGADFAGSIPPGGGPSTGPGPGPNPGVPFGKQPVEMDPLLSWPLHGVNTDSGSIAFDGSDIYYGDIKEDSTTYLSVFKTTVHRLNARTGKELPSVDGGKPVFALDVDRDKRTLLVQDPDDVMWSNKITGGHAPRKLFNLHGDKGGSNSQVSQVALSWDPTLQVFWTFEHAGPDIYMFERDGTPAGHCIWGTNSANGVVGQGNPYVSGAAAIAAAGDGTAYVELEDDQTVLRISRRCGVMMVFHHPDYSEVFGENDAMACDSISFPDTSAIWIRDGDKKTVTSYAVPGGYCPLPTRTTVSAPVKNLALQSQTLVCARVRLPWGPSVPNLDVGLFADSIPLGVGKTDGNGRVCATYAPSVQHQVGTDGAGRKPLQAVFLGNRSYRASQARGALTVLAAPQAATVYPQPAVVVEPPPPPPQQPVQQPAPHAQAAVRQAQTQAQAQLQGQAQPASQANPNAVLVAQQQEQPQLAFVTEGEPEAEVSTQWEMSARERRRPPPAPFGLAACAVTMAAGFAFAYRTVKARAD